MPLLFIGHGSPMNAVQDNEFTRALTRLGASLPRPRAVLCVSAHWLTHGTFVTGMRQPRTIHDFGGFPEELYQVEYPAPGSPDIAEQVRETLGGHAQVDTQEWGLDHGAWAILKFLFPKADIPVLQLSIDFNAPALSHFQLGEKLRPLREQGILIVGSGNIVHNLRRISFDPHALAEPWALEFDEWVKARLLERNYAALIGSIAQAPSGPISVPTPDHYDPLLYILGASDGNDALRFVYEEIQNASISMRSFSLSPAPLA